LGLKRRRRARWRSGPFPSTWLAVSRNTVALFGRLPVTDHGELLGHVQVFLGEEHFEGCGGFTVTDDVCIAIAAQACILLLHRRTDYYPKVRTAVVYPRAYIAVDAAVTENGGVTERVGHATWRVRPRRSCRRSPTGIGRHGVDGRSSGLPVRRSVPPA
jgi:Mlc titration factor MtfA (ptsG expression regulator)